MLVKYLDVQSKNNKMSFSAVLKALNTCDNYIKRWFLALQKSRAWFILDFIDFYERNITKKGNLAPIQVRRVALSYCERNIKWKLKASVCWAGGRGAWKTSTICLVVRQLTFSKVTTNQADYLQVMCLMREINSTALPAWRMGARRAQWIFEYFHLNRLQKSWPLTLGHCSINNQKNKTKQKIKEEMSDFTQSIQILTWQQTSLTRQMLAQ